MNFSTKKSQRENLKFAQVYSVFDADSEYRISFYPNSVFSKQKVPNTYEKPSKPHLRTSIRWAFLSRQCFFTDVFIAFCGA
jgi:hypothetical protein